MKTNTNFQTTRRGFFLSLFLSLIIILLGIFSSSGFFIIDEYVYFLAAHAFYSSGQLFVDNGTEILSSPDLHIWLLRETPHGLTPQYPPGSAVIGGLLYPLAGQKSLIFLNMTAGVATLIVAFLLARRLFGVPGVPELTVLILFFATYWMEFVIGHWPHSVSAFFTTLALYFFVGALERADKSWQPALLSGLSIGAGLLFRVDGVLILPGIIATTLFFGMRPLQTLLGGAGGIAPFVALLALANKWKFGTWNPFSYGSDGGGTSLSGHLPSAIIVFAALLVIVLVRRSGVPRLSARSSMIVVACTIIMVSLLMPFSSYLTRMIAGANAILIDSTSITDGSGRVVRQADGTQLFSGLPKKALGQSLPWLGALTFLIGASWGDRSRSIFLVLACTVAWALPFMFFSWYGGGGGNMRYLLPVVPLLSALTAWILIQIAVQRMRGLRPLLIGALIGYIVAVAFVITFPERVAQVHQIASLYVLYVIAASFLFVGFSSNGLANSWALVVAGAGLGLAHLNATTDLVKTEIIRNYNYRVSAVTAEIPGKVVFYGLPPRFGGAIQNANHLVALPSTGWGNLDSALLRRACDVGFLVVLSDIYTRPVEELGYTVRRMEGDEMATFIVLECS